MQTTITERVELKSIAFASIVAIAASIPNVAEAQDDEFNWSGSVDRGDWVEIRNITGFIAAEPAPGSEVVISAVKSGRSRNFDLVEIELVEESDGITVCVIYPQRNRGRRDRSGSDRNGPCRHGSNSSHSGDIDVDVDFEIRIPAGVNLRASTVSGDVTIENLTGEVSGNSVSGDVFVSTTGIAEATTVSGSIEAHLGRTDWSGELSFSTVSGDVSVYVPEELDADVSFRSVTGDMESDFPITIRRRSGFSSGSLRGTIGEGGRDLEINTVSGNLFLLVEN